MIWNVNCFSYFYIFGDYEVWWVLFKVVCNLCRVLLWCCLMFRFNINFYLWRNEFGFCKYVLIVLLLSRIFFVLWLDWMMCCVLVCLIWLYIFSVIFVLVVVLILLRRDDNIMLFLRDILFFDFCYGVVVCVVLFMM